MPMLAVGVFFLRGNRKEQVTVNPRRGFVRKEKTIMDCSKKIVAGEDCQFSVDIKYPGFDMATEEFSVMLTWGMSGSGMNFDKEDMVEKDGAWLFSFETGDMFGKLVAECRYAVVDATFADGKRNIVERHVLGNVVMSPEVGCCLHRAGCKDKEGFVVFTRVRENEVPLPDAVAIEREERIAGDNANRLLIEDKTKQFDTVGNMFGKLMEAIQLLSPEQQEALSIAEVVEQLVHQLGGYSIVSLTAAEYDALKRTGAIDENTLYFVEEEEEEE